MKFKEIVSSLLEGNCHIKIEDMSWYYIGPLRNMGCRLKYVVDHDNGDYWNITAIGDSLDNLAEFEKAMLKIKKEMF